MKIIICLLFIFINCYKPISLYDSGPIDKKSCNNADYGIDKIEGQIKYLSIFQYFQTQYQADFDYYKLFYSKQLKLIRELHPIIKNLYLVIHQDFPSDRIKDNISPHDSSIEEAYKQLWEIKKFIDLYQWFYKFKEHKKIDLINLDGYQDEDAQIALKKYDKQLIEKKLQYLKRDFQICSGHDFKVDLIQLNNKNLAQEQNQPTSIPPFQIQIQLQTTNYERYELDDFKQKINIEDCPQKIPIIQSLYLEFEKLNALNNFKSSYEKENVFKNFFNQYEQFIIDSLPIRERIQRFEIDEQMILKHDKFNKLLNDQQVLGVYEIERVYFGIKRQSLNQLFDNRIKIYNQIKNYKQLLDQSLLFFSVDKQQLQEIKQAFDSLILFIENFSYPQDYIRTGIKYFERDLEICKSKFDIYDQTQKKNNYQHTIQNQGKQQDLKIETQKDEYCQQENQNIEQQIYYYSQLNEIKQFVTFGGCQGILFSLINQRQIYIYIEELKNYQQILKNKEKLYLVEIYPSHDDPEDFLSTKAYENVVKLQNLIVLLFNAFAKADQFLNYDFSIMESHQKEFQNAIKYDISSQRGDTKEQMDDLFSDYEKCNKKKFPQYYKITDFDVRLYQEYQFKTKFIQKNPQNLLTIPIIVEQFEIKDIPNYENASQQCKADLQGIVEDIIETLKIIELLEYKQFGQNQFDKIISAALKFKKGFLQQNQNIYNFMTDQMREKLINIKKIKNQTYDTEIQEKFSQLQKLNDNIGYLFFAYENSKSLQKFNEQHFNQLEQTQKLVNDYLRDFQKYQLTDMQDQLQELYHEYKVCTGHEFLYDFCQFYEDQNIYGGICQQNCRYEPNTILQNPKKHEISQKLHLQKRKHSKKKQKKKK